MVFAEYSGDRCSTREAIMGNSHDVPWGQTPLYTAIDARLYENWYWWGLDLVADGLVL